MGGKRSDQDNIDPTEGSSSGHKWRVEGHSGDERVENEHKQNLEESRRDSAIPKPGSKPTERERDKKARDDQARGGEKPDSDDDRVDEASRESFPASDPPSY